MVVAIHILAKRALNVTWVIKGLNILAHTFFIVVSQIKQREMVFYAPKNVSVNLGDISFPETRVTL